MPFLQRAFGAGRIPNAYLFAGPRGVGKASTAMILARLLTPGEFGLIALGAIILELRRIAEILAGPFGDD